MEAKKNLPKIVFILSLISFCITVLLFSINYFTNLADDLNGIYFLVSSILLALSMYFTRNSSKIYSIISIILFLIILNIKRIMLYLLVLGGRIWKKKIYLW